MTTHPNAIIDDRTPIVVVYFEMGATYPRYMLNGREVAFLVVEDDKPHDRVYRLMAQTPRDEIIQLIGNSEIGHCEDDRHAAISHKIRRYLESKPRFDLVQDDAPGEAQTQRSECATGAEAPVERTDQTEDQSNSGGTIRDPRQLEFKF